MKIVLIIGIVVLICGLCGILLCLIRTDAKIEARNHINKRIIELFKAGRANEVYNFYDSFVSNKEASIYMVNTALIFDIPVHYFIGLAYQESGFDYRCKSGRNTDGSCDIGLFQLNMNVYKKYNIIYLLEIRNNTRLAGAHLTENYITAGNWYSALGLYNAGHEKHINFNHVKNILLYADMLDSKFSNRF